jgi:uncharacterized protein (TIGR01777 family)
MRVFKKRSVLPATADEVFAWHARPGAFERLNPPFDPVVVDERSGGLEVGARTVVRMRLGPIEQRFVAEHTAFEAGRMFRDEQKRGPFKRWVHTHRFVPETDTASALEDEVEYELPLGLPLPFVEQTLERMFAFRHAVTRMDLERHVRFKAAPRATIALTGASGLIGTALTAYLTTAGHTVRAVRRGPNGGPDPTAFEGADAVVHLAGANVGQRWTKEKQDEFVSSRVAYTRALVEALARCERRPKVLISGSAIGIYGSRGDEELDERSPLPARGTHGAEFLATLCMDWESEGEKAAALGVRVVRLRTGVVLTAAGGALTQMLPAFRLGGGGPIGSGRQYMSWLSLDDELGAIEHALFTDGLSGPVNAVAPAPVTNGELSKVLGRVLHRPSFARVPELAVKALFGEMADATVLASQRVKPGALLASGFSFVQPELEGCLRFTLGR